MPYLIDGYNLLWAVCRVDEGEQVEDSVLCGHIDAYFGRINESGEIIFDGNGPPEKGWVWRLKRLEVVYSGMNREADDVIEQKVERSSAPRRLTVVSNDRRVRRAGQVRRTEVLKCEEFWGAVGVEMRRKRSVSEPKEKREGLSSQETDKWLELFDMDESDSD
jgi:predicted RNA-binding protein with PIN domain